MTNHVNNVTKKEVRTNYDDITNFTVDEMASFLAGLSGLPGLPKAAGFREERKKAMKEWLLEEAE